MKRLFMAVLVMAVIAVTAAGGLAQGNPRGSARLMLGGKQISVEYGRPSLKGRAVSDLLSQLKPGDFWRLGADKSAAFCRTAARCAVRRGGCTGRPVQPVG